MTTMERVKKAKEIALERLEYIYNCEPTPDFVQVRGDIGGDIVTLRVYDDGSVYAT